MDFGLGGEHKALGFHARKAERCVVFCFVVAISVVFCFSYFFRFYHLNGAVFDRSLGSESALFRPKIFEEDSYSVCSILFMDILP